MDENLTLAAASKAAAYVLGQLAVGVGIVRRLARDGNSGISDVSRIALQVWLGRLARLASGLLIAVLLLRLWAQTASAFGPAEAWSIENLRVIAIESRWGSGWRWQMIAAAALLVAALTVVARGSAWLFFDGAAVAVALAMPLLGHAGGSAPRHALHAVHNLGAAIWLGTLGVIVLAAWRWRSIEGVGVAGLTRRFSPLALRASVVVGVSGAVAAWLYVGSWAAMWTTAYGQLLTAKLAVVVLVIACGWTNWQAVKRGAPSRRVVMTVEWIAALVVLGLTGVLTETEHP